MEQTLHISAGGANTRISNYLERQHNGAPKALLPLPGTGLTLISKIVSDAENTFEQIIVHTTPLTHSALVDHLSSKTKKVEYRCSEPASFLSPLLAEMNTSDRAFICSCDFYSSVTWNDLIDFHESHNFDVSCVATNSAPSIRGTTVLTKDKRVVGWQSNCRVSASDYVNLGMYVFELSDEVSVLLRKLLPVLDEKVEPELIKKKLLACLSKNIIGFNVNYCSSYEKLISYLNNGHFNN